MFKSLHVDCSSQLCVATVLQLWYQPAYNQCIPDCINLISGSWHGDSHGVSSVQLADKSCGHYPIVSPPIHTVLHNGLLVSTGNGGQLAVSFDHVDTIHDPQRGGWLVFSSKTTVTLAEVGIFLVAWVSPIETLALKLGHTGRKVWEIRRFGQEARQQNEVGWAKEDKRI